MGTPIKNWRDTPVWEIGFIIDFLISALAAGGLVWSFGWAVGLGFYCIASALNQINERLTEQKYND
jgi:hypothetical protein